MAERRSKSARAARLLPVSLAAASNPNPRPSAALGAPFPAEDRQRLIAERAYLIAAERGFGPGRELDDWLQAEAQVGQSMPAQ